MKIIEYLQSKYPDIRWTYEAETGKYKGTLGDKYIAFIKDDKSFISKPGRAQLYDFVNELRQAQ